MWRLRPIALGLIGVFLIVSRAVLACPLCSTAVEDDPVAAAFNSTTFMMIAAPIVLVGSIGGWVVYRYWRSARRAAAAAHLAWGPIWTEEESET
jgi:ABC-type nickel/cobalt efflux system permease component RcnA